MQYFIYRVNKDFLENKEDQNFQSGNRYYRTVEKAMMNADEEHMTLIGAVDKSSDIGYKAIGTYTVKDKTFTPVLDFDTLRALQIVSRLEEGFSRKDAEEYVNSIAGATSGQSVQSMQSFQFIYKGEMIMSKVLLTIDLGEQGENEEMYNKCTSFVKETQKNYRLIYKVNFKEDISLVQENSTDTPVSFCKIHSLNTGCWGMNLVQDLLENIKMSDKVYIMGCLSDARVVSLFLLLRSYGFTNIKVLTDYCYTTFPEISKNRMFKILSDNFDFCLVQEACTWARQDYR